MMVRELKKNLSTGAFFNSATYLVGPRGPEYRRDDTATELDSQGRTVSKCRWYVFDGLGSVVGEMDPSGNMTSSPKYDVYGLVRSNPGTASSKMGFVGGLGHVSDTETGLIYMRARYYDPSNGRFESEDPDAQGNNWFAYCNNNPINEVDQSGKNAGLIVVALAAILYITTNVFFRDSLPPALKEALSGINDYLAAVGLALLGAAAITAGAPVAGCIALCAAFLLLLGGTFEFTEALMGGPGAKNYGGAISAANTVVAEIYGAEALTAMTAASIDAET